MGLKLEELRNRLLQPVPVSPTSYPTLEPGRQVWSASPIFWQQPPTENSQDALQRSAYLPEESSSARSGAEIVPLTEPAHQNTGDQAEPTFADFVEIRKMQARIEE